MYRSKNKTSSQPRNAAESGLRYARLTVVITAAEAKHPCLLLHITRHFNNISYCRPCVSCMSDLCSEPARIKCHLLHEAQTHLVPTLDKQFRTNENYQFNACNVSWTVHSQTIYQTVPRQSCYICDKYWISNVGFTFSLYDCVLFFYSVCIFCKLSLPTLKSTL